MLLKTFIDNSDCWCCFLSSESSLHRRRQGCCNDGMTIDEYDDEHDEDDPSMTIVEVDLEAQAWSIGHDDGSS